MRSAWRLVQVELSLFSAGFCDIDVKEANWVSLELLLGLAVRAPYFHRSWVNLPWGTPEDELRHRLATSYKLVRASLTKKVQAQLDPFE